MALYQQGVQRIEVVVTKMGGSAGPKGAQEKDTASNDESNEEKTSQASVGRSERFKKTTQRAQIAHGIAVSRQIVGLAINYRIGGIGYQTGDQSYQELVRREVEIVTDFASLASSAAMGAYYGRFGGPQGAIIGAALATAATTASIATKYANRRRDNDVKLFKQESGISYKRARASINLTTGRLR